MQYRLTVDWLFIILSDVQTKMMCRGGRSMDMQREDVKYKQNQLKNLESQKIDYENKKQDIDWQIQELKEKKRK